MVLERTYVCNTFYTHVYALHYNRHVYMLVLTDYYVRMYVCRTYIKEW